MSTLDSLLQLRGQLDGEIAKTERVLSDLELHYLQSEVSQCGSVLKGFDGFLSSKDNLRKRSRTFKAEDRVFSLSSKTSPVTREVEQSNLDMMEGAPMAGFGKKGYAQKSYATKGYAQKGKR